MQEGAVTHAVAAPALPTPQAQSLMTTAEFWQMHVYLVTTMLNAFSQSPAAATMRMVNQSSLPSLAAATTPGPQSVVQQAVGTTPKAASAGAPPPWQQGDSLAGQSRQSNAMDSSADTVRSPAPAPVPRPAPPLPPPPAKPEPESEPEDQETQQERDAAAGPPNAVPPDHMPPPGQARSRSPMRYRRRQQNQQERIQSRMDKHAANIQRRGSRGRPEWMCSICAQSNYMSYPTCRSCERERPVCLPLHPGVTVPPLARMELMGTGPASAVQRPWRTASAAGKSKRPITCASSAHAGLCIIRSSSALAATAQASLTTSRTKRAVTTGESCKDCGQSKSAQAQSGSRREQLIIGQATSLTCTGQVAISALQEATCTASTQGLVCANDLHSRDAAGWSLCAACRGNEYQRRRANATKQKTQARPQVTRAYSNLGAPRTFCSYTGNSCRLAHPHCVAQQVSYSIECTCGCHQIRATPLVPWGLAVQKVVSTSAARACSLLDSRRAKPCKTERPRQEHLLDALACLSLLISMMSKPALPFSCLLVCILLVYLVVRPGMIAGDAAGLMHRWPGRCHRKVLPCARIRWHATCVFVLLVRFPLDCQCDPPGTAPGMPTWHLHIGEATQPGPRRLRSKSAPHLLHSDTQSTHIDTSLDTTDDSQVSLADASQPTRPADQMPMDSQQNATETETQQSELPPSTLLQQRAQLEAMLHCQVRRIDAPPATVTCNYIYSKDTWRWQCRAKPHTACVERRTPSSALQGWLSKNQHVLTAETYDQLQQHALDLVDKVDVLRQHAMDKKQPKLANGDPVDSRAARVAPTSVQLAPQEEFLSMEQLQQLITVHIPTERYIPATCRRLVADLIAAFVQAPLTLQAAMHVLVLPKLIWNSGFRQDGRQVRGHERQHELERKARAALSGRWQALFTEAIMSARPIPAHNSAPDTPGQQAQRLSTAARQGNPMKCWHLLHSPGCEPSTDTNWGELCQKLAPTNFPHCDLPAPAQPADNSLLTMQSMQTSILRLRNGKALDSSGWSHEAIQQLWGNAHLREHLRAWLHFLYGQEWPADDIRCAHYSRAVLLRKPHSPGIRPILIQMAWKKIWNACLFRTLRVLTEDRLGQMQFGIGVADGAARMHASIQASMSTAMHPLAVQVDVKNAFGSISRTAVWRTLSTQLDSPLFQQYAPYLLMYLRQPIWVSPQHAPDAPWFASHQGLIQGDPLSTWLFSSSLALTLQQHLPPAVQCACYIDDTILHGEASAVDEAWPMAQRAFESLSLEIQPAKTAAYSPQGPDVRGLLHHLSPVIPDIRIDGLKICGHYVSDELALIPSGESTFIQDTLREYVLQIDRNAQQLLVLMQHMAANSLQVMSYILRVTMPARFLHLLRSLPLELTAEFCESMERLLKALWSQLIAIPHFTAEQWRLATLPLSHGGLGLPDIMELAAQSRLVCLIKFPRAGSHVPYLRVCFQRELETLLARTAANIRFPIETLLRTSFDAPDVSSLRTLQRKLRAHLSNATAHQLREAYQAEVTPLRHHWSLHCVSTAAKPATTSPGQGTWMLSLPLNEHMAITDEAWRWAMRQRLGILVAGTHGACSVQKHGHPCGIRLDQNGWHSNICPRELYIRRHNAVCLTLAELGRAAGCVTMQEQRLGSEIPAEPQDNRMVRPTRTADVTFVDPTGRHILVDVRITAKPVAGQLPQWLQHHQTHKRAEYGLGPTLASELQDSVRPFIVECSGYMSPCAEAVWNHLIALAVDQQMIVSPAARSWLITSVRRRWEHRLSIALLRFRYAAAQLAAGSAHTCMPEDPAPAAPLQNDVPASLHDAVADLLADEQCMRELSERGPESS